MRVLAITPELPSANAPGSMAPAARQIQSLADIGIDMVIQDMRGIPKLKYLLASPKMHGSLSGIDLIHAHFGYCGWIARTQWRKPIVVSFMGDDLLGTPNDCGGLEWFSRVMVRANQRLARYVTQVIVKSQEMANVIAPVPCHVIPNGVDTELFAPRPRRTVREQLGWDIDRTYLLFPGNPDNPRKGFALAKAATEVTERRLGRNVEIIKLWRVPPDQVAMYMNGCDAMWMTSLIEGSPNVVKEAMACNLPVVGVPVGDVEHLLDGVAGYSVCPRDPELLGNQMAQLLRQTPHVQGRESIESRGLSLQAVALRIRDVYQLALGQSPRSANLDSSNMDTYVHASRTKVQR